MTKTLLSKELFSAFFGSSSILPELEYKQFSQHSAVLTDFDGGGVRCLTIVWEKLPDGTLQMAIKYLYHTNGKTNHSRDLLKLEAKPEGHDHYALSSVWLAPEVSSKALGLNLAEKDDVARIADFSRRMHESIAGRGEWINPVGAAQKAGIAVKTIGARPLPGLYSNGEIQTNVPAQHHADDNLGPVYLAPFFMPVFGLNPRDDRQSRSITVRDEKTNTTYVLSHSHNTSADGKSITQGVTLTSFKNGESTSWPVYEMQCGPFTPGPLNRKIYTGLDETAMQVRKITFFDLGEGANTGTPRVIDLSDQKATNIAMKSIRMLNRTIRAGQTTLEDDLRRIPQDRRFLLPTDIFLSTGLFPYLAPATPAPKKTGRFTFRPLGGNNTREIFSSADRHIGANAYILSYYPPGKSTADAIMIDTGVLFHDEFDVTFFNAGRFLKHRDNPAHVPEQNIQAILFTHRHKDHVGQLAYLVKTGYVLPALIMDEMSLRQIKREMDELDIDRRIRDAVLEKCHVIDINAPAKYSKTKVGGVQIIETTESLSKAGANTQPGFKLGSQRAEYDVYPVLSIGEHFKIHVGPMPHSAPGLCFHVVTAAGSHLHMGDPKLDDSILLDLPSFRAWLSNRKPDTISVDCTGTTRADKPTPIESEIRDSVSRLFSDNPDNRFICPVLGSNAARILTLVAAMGDAGRKYLIVDGKALEDTMHDLEEIHHIKKWAQRNFGVTIALKTTKEAQRILNEEDDSSIVCAVTGTQDEMYSTLNRALRDWLPGSEAGGKARMQLRDTDIIAFLQGPIPVGDNIRKRQAIANMGQDFHGARVLLPELIRDESLILAGSGHCGPREIAEIISLVKPRAAFLVHGGPEQLAAGQAIVGKQGIEGYILDATQEATVSSTRAPVNHFRSSPAELIGIHSRIRDTSKFYLKGIFTSYVVPLKPIMGNAFGRALDGFEQAMRERCSIPAIHAYIETQIFSLSRMFNKVGVNGYLAHKISFGVDKYPHRDVMGEKNIRLIAAFDTETTGLNAHDHRITQFALSAWRRNGRKHEALSVDLRQRIPEYVVASPEALLVTSTRPQNLNEGLHPIVFAEKIDEAFKNLRDAATEENKSKKDSNAKILALAHNKRFDDRMINRTMAESLHHRGRPHHFRGVISMDTRIIARALLAYAPKKFSCEYRTDENGKATNIPNLTLGSLCRANGIAYDESKAHKNASYDLKCCHALYTKMYEVAPEIVGQMIINADHSTGHLISDMTAANLGFDSPHPVFTYVSPLASRPAPQMGCFVSMMDSGRKAVVFNLKHNPEDYLSRSAEEIAALVADPKCDVFEVFDLKDQPIIAPARMGFGVRANGGMLKETLDRRASVVKAYTLYKDPAHNMTSFEDRLGAAFERNHKYPAHNAYEPDMLAPVPSLKGLSGDTPLTDAYTNLSVAGNSQLHRTNRAAVQELKLYREAVLEYLSAEDPALKAEALIEASRTFKRVKLLKDSGGMGNLDILNIHYDIATQDLSEAERERVLRYRHAQGYRMALEADRQWAALKADDGAGLKRFSPSPAFARNLESYIKAARSRYPLNDMVREHAHQWRKTFKNLEKTIS